MQESAGGRLQRVLWRGIYEVEQQSQLDCIDFALCLSRTDVLAGHHLLLDLPTSLLGQKKEFYMSNLTSEPCHSSKLAQAHCLSHLLRAVGPEWDNSSTDKQHMDNWLEYMEWLVKWPTLPADICCVMEVTSSSTVIGFHDLTLL